MANDTLTRLAWLSIEGQRAMLEAGILGAASPFLLFKRGGDGHPVYMVPGLSGEAASMAPMRVYVKALGHPTYGPWSGATKGSAAWVRDRIINHLDRVVQKKGEAVTLIGWSIGGCAVREVAYVRPDLIRQVITLGTPLVSRWYSQHNQEARERLEVPTTVIYSTWDKVFHWEDCVAPSAPRLEHVNIHSSHFGMASNAQAWHVIADRLALPRGTWEPYEAPVHFPVHNDTEPVAAA